jgi:hypothetical protein
MQIGISCNKPNNHVYHLFSEVIIATSLPPFLPVGSTIVELMFDVRKDTTQKKSTAYVLRKASLIFITFVLQSTT